MIVGLQKDYRIALFASPVPTEQAILESHCNVIWSG